MKLAKALKVKNRLAGEVAKLEEIVRRENTRRSDNPSTIDVEEVYTQWSMKSLELVKVKSAIAKANIDIYYQIAEMEEYKNHITKLQMLNVKEGPEIVFIGRDQEKMEYVWTPFINAEKRDELIQETQNKINNLQDKIDDYNANTDVNL